MAGNLAAAKAGTVAQIAPAIVLRVAVEDLVVPTDLGHAQTVFHPRDRREVAGNHQEIIRVFCTAEISECALRPVMAIDPLKTLVLEIELVEGLFRRNIPFRSATHFCRPRCDPTPRGPIEDSG